MLFRQLLNDDAACASYVPGGTTEGVLAVAEPHIDPID